jgi:hypothetical protein
MAANSNFPRMRIGKRIENLDTQGTAVPFRW